MNAMNFAVFVLVAYGLPVPIFALLDRPKRKPLKN
jgi:hypothetical protein